MSAGFSVIDLPGKGKLVIATKDFLPGEVIFREEPLIIVTNQLMDSFKKFESSGIERAIWAFEQVFYQRLDTAKQEAFLGLYFPSNGSTSTELYEHLLAASNKNHWEESRLDILFKISMIYSFNAFSVKGTRRVYEMCTRMNHSCLGNCRVDFPADDKDTAVWTAVSSIQAGDEMSITYGACRYDMKPTSTRRGYYLSTKEFLCTCPRCTALGDDTRQFNCFDKTCAGRHYVAQNTANGAVSMLLPCIKCDLTPSDQFTQEMFKWERNFDIFKARCLEAVIRDNRDPWTIQYPDCHLKSITLSHALFELSTSCETKLVFAKKFVKPIECLVLPPNMQHSEWFALVASMFLATGTAEGITLAKHYARKAVRDRKVMFGRDTQNASQGEVACFEALSKMPPQKACTTECMFCGVTPELADCVLSKCDKCKAVTYCSLSCFRNHYALHKQVCFKLNAERCMN
jgi:hypothetical protein